MRWRQSHHELNIYNVELQQKLLNIFVTTIENSQ